MPSTRSFTVSKPRCCRELNKRGIAALGMKPINGHGEPVKARGGHAQEALRYAMSLPVTTTITGMESLEVLHQNLAIAQGFQPMSPQEMQALRDRVKRKLAADGRFELYKLSLKFDNPEARLAHQFPLDMQSVEVKEMMQATKNTGHPFPKVRLKAMKHGPRITTRVGAHS